jgi:hypothetical protein
MSKKIIALFTMVAFVGFSLSCFTHKNVRVETIDAKEKGKIRILQVVNTSGEIFEFSAKHPGRIHKDRIVGTTERVARKIEIDRANIKEIRKDKTGILAITTRDGKVYQVYPESEKERADTIIFAAISELSVNVSIPLRDVETVKFEKKSPGKSLLGLLGAIVGVVAFYALFIWEGMKMFGED